MKVKRIEIAASILTLSLTVVMSGCSVSINLNNKKKEATESMETIEKKERNSGTGISGTFCICKCRKDTTDTTN